MTDHNASLPPPHGATWPAPHTERRAAAAPAPAASPAPVAPDAARARKPSRKQRKELEREAKQDKDAKRRGPLRTSLLIGFVVLAGLIIAGAIAVAARPQEYAAEASVVILPVPGADRATEAGLFETLSRGQIVETFAELTRNQRFAAQAKNLLELTPSERKGAWVEVSTVPSTSIVLIRAHARDPQTAERLADKTMALATEYFAKLPQPFRTDQVDTADGNAEQSGQSKVLLLLAVVAVAFAAALALQQASHQLLLAHRARRGPGTPTAATSTRPADTTNGDGGAPPARPTGNSTA